MHVHSQTYLTLLVLLIGTEEHSIPLVIEVSSVIVPCDVDEVVVQLEHYVVRFIKLQLKQGPIVSIPPLLQQHALVRVIELEPQISTKRVQGVPRREYSVKVPFLLEPPAIVV